jgi:hypothetical protein
MCSASRSTDSTETYIPHTRYKIQDGNQAGRPSWHFTCDGWPRVQRSRHGAWRICLGIHEHGPEHEVAAKATKSTVRRCGAISWGFQSFSRNQPKSAGAWRFLKGSIYIERAQTSRRTEGGQTDYKREAEGEAKSHRKIDCKRTDRYPIQDTEKRSEKLASSKGTDD